MLSNCCGNRVAKAAQLASPCHASCCRDGNGCASHLSLSIKLRQSQAQKTSNIYACDAALTNDLVMHCCSKPGRYLGCTTHALRRRPIIIAKKRGIYVFLAFLRQRCRKAKQALLSF